MFEFTVAFRYLLTHRKEQFISIINVFAIIGIALGVATLIVVMSVMNGYEIEMVDKFLGIQSHITLHYKTYDIDKNDNNMTYSANYSRAINVLKKSDEILYFAPIIEGRAAIQAMNVISGIMVRGIAASDIVKKPLVKDSLMEGSWNALYDNANSFNNNIIIGLTLARSLNARIGSSIKVIVPQMSYTIAGEIPRSKTFQVAGIFDVGRSDYNEMLVFISLKSAQILFQKNNQINFIETVLKSINDIEITKQRLSALLGKDWYIRDWKEVNGALMQALAVERNVMFLILSLIILIAVFNIISSLMILVKDKQKSIAILRTMGAKQSSVMLIFIICGFSIGVFGTAIGGVIGVSFALNIDAIKGFLENFIGITLFDPMIYFLTTLPSKVYSTQILWILLLALGLSLIATIYPAVRISRLAPYKILRYE